jgi:hypothetical protein
MLGVMIVRIVDDVPDRDVTRHSMSRVKVNGNVHCRLDAALVLPACTQVDVPTGRTQTVTRSPGTAMPVTVWVVFQCTLAGPVAVGGKVARMVSVPVAADPKPVVTRQSNVDPAAFGIGRRMRKAPVVAAVVVATVV